MLKNSNLNKTTNKFGLPVAKAELFETSGHYDKYKDDMFTIHSHYSDDELFKADELSSTHPNLC